MNSSRALPYVTGASGNSFSGFIFWPPSPKSSQGMAVGSWPPSLLHKQPSQKLPRARGPRVPRESRPYATSAGLGLQPGRHVTARSARGVKRERGTGFKASPMPAPDSFLLTQSCPRHVNGRNCYGAWLGWWFRHVVRLGSVQVPGLSPEAGQEGT